MATAYVTDAYYGVREKFQDYYFAYQQYPEEIRAYAGSLGRRSIFPIVTGAAAASIGFLAFKYGGIRSVTKVAALITGTWVAVNAGSVRDGVLRRLLSSHRWLYERNSWAVTLNALTVKLFSIGKNSTFSYQSVLPELPIPRLNDTAAKLRATVRPLVSDKDYDSFDRLLTEFVNDPNQGAHLQRKLRVWAMSKGYGPVLDEVWDGVYFFPNTPLVGKAGSSNNFASRGFRTMKTDHEIPLVGYGAQAVWAAVRFWDLIRSGNLEPIRIGGFAPICMDQYKLLCGSSRIPQEGLDIRVQDLDSRHAVVYCKGRYYKLDVDNKVEGRPLHISELEHQIEAIWHHAEANEKKKAPQVGLLTSQDRSEWAKDYEALAEHNLANLATINTALFVLLLDERTPETLTDHGYACYTPPGAWYDKSLQIVMFAHGKPGAHLEHSWGEATTAGHMFSWASKIKDEDMERGAVNPTQLPPVQALEWNLPSLIEQKIPFVGELLEMNAENFEFEVFQFDEFSKETIKTLRVSPDSFIQMAIQLAYYRLHKRFRFTYETAGTRLYYHARTETCRSVSNDSVAFCKAMVDKNPNAGALLRRAIATHKRYMLEASDGYGVDRQVLMWKVMMWLEQDKAKKQGLEPPSYPLLEHPALNLPIDIATSQVICDFNGGGFPPLTQDGYGVCYTVFKDFIAFHLSAMVDSHESDTQRLREELENALRDMRAVLA